MKKQESRADGIDPGKWMTAPFKKTGEGFLQGRAIVTSVGVFSYRDPDGTVTRELRLPEEVFHQDSLESMKGKPVSNGHPKDRITAENAKKYQVGSLGSTPSSWFYVWCDSESKPEGRGLGGTDGFHVAIDMTVTDAQAIADIEAGKRALSMGYDCETEPAEPGATWCGMVYDRVQRKIRYNHCAIVDKARAGGAARIREDGEGAERIKIKRGEEPMAMKKIRIDGVEYEGEEGLVKCYADQKKRADGAEEALKECEAALKKIKKELSELEA